MRISLTLDDVKKIIAEKFDVQNDTVSTYLERKLVLKIKENDQYDLLDSHLVFEFDKPMVKEKENKWKV